MADGRTTDNGALSTSLAQVAQNDELLEVGRKAIEDALIAARDDRVSEPMRSNGLCIRERDATRSDVIRFGPETALRIGMTAIAAHLQATPAAGNSAT